MTALSVTLYKALEETEKELAEFVAECGGCDHSVGICFCSTERVLERARAALALAKSQNIAIPHEGGGAGTP